MLYKNLLQELAQKEGFRVPVYSTERSGEAHLPKFVSQVEVEGEVFTGQEAKTKKQAEMSAAKVAYTTLKERKGIYFNSSFIVFHFKICPCIWIRKFMEIWMLRTDHHCK